MQNAENVCAGSTMVRLWKQNFCENAKKSKKLSVDYIH
jgi:hypothetical protein